jgi:predicted RNA-binding Zn-ribbon protein involved in translation (DUF1610 family)
MLAPTSGAAENIARLKQQRRLRNALIWLAIPSLLLCAAALNRLFHVRWGLFIAFVLWTLAIVVVGRRVRQWPCPNCGNPVMQNGSFHNDFARNCLHCGLALTHKHTQLALNLHSAQNGWAWGILSQIACSRQ